MSDYIKSALAWKLAIFKGVNGWLIAVCLVLFAVDIDWDTMNTWSKVRFFGCAILAGMKFLDGFLDQTINNIKKTRNPLGVTEIEKGQ
jgi:hypothetical protein